MSSTYFNRLSATSNNAQLLMKKKKKFNSNSSLRNCRLNFCGTAVLSQQRRSYTFYLAQQPDRLDFHPEISLIHLASLSLRNQLASKLCDRSHSSHLMTSITGITDTSCFEADLVLCSFSRVISLCDHGYRFTPFSLVLLKSQPFSTSLGQKKRGVPRL